MTDTISAKASEREWLIALVNASVPFLHAGKVRNTYGLSNELLLQCATDRISIFDFILPATIPGKGEILTALTILNLTEVLTTFKHHLRAFGSDISAYLPESLSGNRDLQKRALVVRKQKIVPIECIVRGYLTGTGWKEYQESGTACGQNLPKGLFDGAKLPEPIFTPSTKEETGHDRNISFEEMVGLVGRETAERLREDSLGVYNRGSEYARSRGLLIADTKLEFGDVLADEVLTPDSSRFWDEEEWVRSSTLRKTPSSCDKEFVRQWGKTVETPWGVGIHKLDPANEEHLAFVHSIEVPADIIAETSARYHRIFERLSSRLSLVEFQSKVMGIAP